MEVIKNLTKKDINTSIMKIKKQGFINDYDKAIADLDEKIKTLKSQSKAIKEGRDRLYKILGNIIKYCGENNITVYNQALKIWESLYNCSWEETPDVYKYVRNINGIYKSETSTNHLDCENCDNVQSDVEIDDWDVSTCSYTPQCSYCNNSQSGCKEAYASSIVYSGCQECDSCNNNFACCTVAYNISCINCQGACVSVFCNVGFGL